MAHPPPPFCCWRWHVHLWCIGTFLITCSTWRPQPVCSYQTHTRSQWNAPPPAEFITFHWRFLSDSSYSHTFLRKTRSVCRSPVVWRAIRVPCWNCSTTWIKQIVNLQTETLISVFIWVLVFIILFFISYLFSCFSSYFSFFYFSHFSYFLKVLHSIQYFYTQYLLFHFFKNISAIFSLCAKLNW